MSISEEGEKGGTDVPNLMGLSAGVRFIKRVCGLSL